MSATATPAPALGVSLSALADEYLHMLANERGASAHTLRAYRRELHGFVEFIVEHHGYEHNARSIEHTQIRAYLGAL